MLRLKLLLLLIIILGSSSFVMAGTTGKIAGKVIDQTTGEPLIGANVFIPELNIGGSTDSEGYYYIINVPPGEYDVKASYVGYEQITISKVKVQIDRTTSLDFSLVSKSVESEEIVVEAKRERIERDQTSTMQNIDDDELATLPVNTIEGALSLQTGVVSEDGGFHLRGGRTGEVAFYIDGYRIEDALFNGQVVEINNEAIQQMELLSGTFNAEYGNALSGVVNIVTKENFRKVNATLSYKRTNLGIEGPSNNLNENYIEGYFNGPLWSGSPVGLLVSGKRVTADNYYFSGNSYLDENTGTYKSIEFSEDETFGYDDYWTGISKLYFRPFGSGKVTFLYNFSDREWKNYSHSLRFIPDSTYIRNSQSHLGGINFTHAVSKDLFYEIRLSYYNYQYLRNIAGLHYSDYPVPTYLRFGNSRFYRTLASSGFEDQTTQTYTVKGDLSYQIDKYNYVKTGFEFKQHQMDYFYISNPNNPAARFQIDYNKKPYEGAVYIQDKIEFSTIILNLGLRFDFYDPSARYTPNPYDNSRVTEADPKTSFSPRVGVAYPVRDNMVFHFSYGQFFQRPEYQVMYENLNREFSYDQPIFGNPNLEPEKTNSYEIGLNTTLGENATLQTTFFSKKIENLVGVVWDYERLAYASYVNEDFAQVKGFEISSEWDIRNLSLSANYTYQIAEGSSSSQQERYSGAFDIIGKQSLKFLPLDFDQRHSANGSINIYFRDNEGPFGFLPSIFENINVNFIMRYGSGLPYTFNPARSRYVAERNNSRLPSTFFMDMYLSKRIDFKDFYLTIFADVRNLLDRDNVRSVYSATGKPDETGSLLSDITPDYEQDPTNYYNPRTIYFGAKIGI